jgi:hypothetical protein
VAAVSSVDSVVVSVVSVLAVSSSLEHAANNNVAVTSRGRVRRIATTLLAKPDRPTSTRKALTQL